MFYHTITTFHQKAQAIQVSREGMKARGIFPGIYVVLFFLLSPPCFPNMESYSVWTWPLLKWGWTVWVPCSLVGSFDGLTNVVFSALAKWISLSATSCVWTEELTWNYKIPWKQHWAWNPKKSRIFLCDKNIFSQIFFLCGFSFFSLFFFSRKMWEWEWDCQRKTLRKEDIKYLKKWTTFLYFLVSVMDQYNRHFFSLLWHLLAEVINFGPCT